MTWDWKRLGQQLAAARGSRTQQDVARQLDIGLSTLQAIEHGRGFRKVTPTIRAYARLLGWSDDSPEHVLAGGDPRTNSAGETPSEHHADVDAAKSIATSGLSLDVVQALQEGPLLDTQVLTVSTPGGEVRATIVVRGEPDASPEELHQALLAWRLRKQALRQLDDDS